METKKKRPTISSLLETIGKLKIEHQRSLFTLNKKNEMLTAELLIANQKISIVKTQSRACKIKRKSSLHRLNN